MVEEGAWGGLGVVDMASKVSGEAGSLLTNCLGPLEGFSTASDPRALGRTRISCSESSLAFSHAFQSPSLGNT